MSINSINYNPYLYTGTKSVLNSSRTINYDEESSLSFQNNDTFNYTVENTKTNDNNEVSVDSLRESINKTKSEQGLIGKLWDGFKNLTNIGAGSNKAEKAIDDYTNGKITKEEMEKAVKGYQEGQNMVVDVVADIASGILAVGAFALAVPTGSLSLVAGLGLSTVTGAGIKVGIKATDALIGGRKYTSKDLLYDGATGSVNGLLAPVTNGIGNSVTKTVASKIIKEGGEELAKKGIRLGLKQGLKSILLNQTVEVTGGTVLKRAAAMGVGMAVDGALSGAADNMVRAGLNGENIIKAGVDGAIGGAIMSPIIGGGFHIAGKAGRLLNNKITMSKILPEGMSTTFKQGSVGDCALLSTLDGMMDNPVTSSKIKKSITKTLLGDYNIQIGDTIVQVPKSAISDEILSDKTGIKLFEKAYEQLNGSLNGGFAEVVAEQFGLNPIHITSDAITDELLDNLAKNRSNTILSFGTLVDTNGTITNTNGTRHYFTIKNIDADSKIVTLTSPIDTSKTISLSYQQVKDLGISIDGGTTKAIDLPNSIRDFNEVRFEGKNAPKTKGLVDTKYIEKSILEGKTPDGVSVMTDGTIVVNAQHARGDAYYAIYKPSPDGDGFYWYDSRYATSKYGFVASKTPIKDLYFSQLDINANGKDIVKSIKKHGFKGEALHAVRMTVDGKEYLFCYDNRRLSAAIQCKMESLPVVIHDASEQFRQGDPLCTKTWGSKIIERLKNYGRGTIIEFSGSSKNPIYTSSGLPLDTFYEIPVYRNTKMHSQPKYRDFYTKGYLK